MNDKLIKTVDTIYQLEREIEGLKAKLTPLREELIEKIELGTHTIGDHIVIKKHVDETFVKAFTRKAYDTIQVK